VVELFSTDGGLAVFTAIGIVATAISIVRDTRAQKARVVTEEVPVARRTRRVARQRRPAA
jgi:hypothetical protein